MALLLIVWTKDPVYPETYNVFGMNSPVGRGVTIGKQGIQCIGAPESGRVAGAPE